MATKKVKKKVKRKEEKQELTLYVKIPGDPSVGIPTEYETLTIKSNGSYFKFDTEMLKDSLAEAYGDDAEVRDDDDMLNEEIGWWTQSLEHQPMLKTNKLKRRASVTYARRILKMTVDEIKKIFKHEGIPIDVLPS